MLKVNFVAQSSLVCVFLFFTQKKKDRKKNIFFTKFLIIIKINVAK